MDIAKITGVCPKACTTDRQSWQPQLARRAASSGRGDGCASNAQSLIAALPPRGRHPSGVHASEAVSVPAPPPPSGTGRAVTRFAQGRHLGQGQGRGDLVGDDGQHPDGACCGRRSRSSVSRRGEGGFGGERGPSTSSAQGPHPGLRTGHPGVAAAAPSVPDGGGGPRRALRPAATAGPSWRLVHLRHDLQGDGGCPARRRTSQKNLERGRRISGGRAAAPERDDDGRWPPWSWFRFDSRAGRLWVRGFIRTCHPSLESPAARRIRRVSIPRVLRPAKSKALLLFRLRRDCRGPGSEGFVSGSNLFRVEMSLVESRSDPGYFCIGRRRSAMRQVQEVPGGGPDPDQAQPDGTTSITGSLIEN